MRIPATAMTGHLMWTRHGTIWATWRLEGMPRGFGNSESREISERAHRALFQSILGEYLLLGLTAELDPKVIVDSMLDGVNLLEHPGWAEECLLTLDRLKERPQGRREYWLSVPLRSGSVKSRALGIQRQFDTSLRESLSMPLRPPSAAEISAALQAAGKIEEAIPAFFKPQRSTVAEQVWIAAHSQTRGLELDLAAPTSAGNQVGGVAERYSLKSGTRFETPKAFPEPILDEGGQTDVDSRVTRFNPLTRRFLKVINPRLESESYQVMMALASTPKGGWESSLDWVGRLDELGVNADWAFRISATPARDAKRRNSRSEVNIVDQMDQQSATAAITGTGSELDDIAAILAEYHRALGGSDREVEIQASMIVAIGGPTPEDARDRAAFVSKDFAAMDFGFDTPLGGQEGLWWAMQPGIPTERIVRDFTELTTGSEFATLLPITSSDLGDETGFLFAENVTSGTARPVMLDLWGQITGDVSGSVGACGEPGGGKSVLIKDILGSVHDRGGRFVAIDRTQAKEYGEFAESLDPQHVTIVDLTEPRFSLDPLRMFGPQIGAGQMLTLCSALLGVPARSPGGVMLARLLDQKSVDGLTSAGALLHRLEQLSDSDETANQLLGLMGLYSSNEYGRVLFDESLPPLDLGSRGIVFLTHGVSLPDRDEIDNANLFGELPLDKLFGRAMYALLTRIAREICFERRHELTLFAVDEVQHVTDSPQGLQELTRFYRDGRKHGAPVLVAGQDARDFGDEVARGLIKNRIVMRQTTVALAQENLEWLHKGLGDDPELIRIVSEDLSPLGNDGKVPLDRRGEGLMRDARGRMGKVRKTVALRPERRAATLSTPGQRQQATTELIGADR